MAVRRATLVGAVTAIAVLAGAVSAQAAERRCTGVIGPETVSGDLVVPRGEVCDLAGTRVLGTTYVRNRAELYAEAADLRGNVEAERQAFVELSDDSTLAGNLKLVESLGASTEGGTVAGNIESTGTEFLDMVMTTINGNVKIEGGRTTAFAEAVQVGGSLEAIRAEYFDLYDSTVNGNFVVRDTRQGSIFCGNTLNGTPEFTADRGLLTIGAPGEACDGNRINGNLKVEGNRAETEISDNEISGNLTCFDNRPPPVGGGNRVGGNKEGQCEAL
jgi:hypothetical protein